jgi:hypothetical protein
MENSGEQKIIAYLPHLRMEDLSYHTIAKRLEREGIAWVRMNGLHCACEFYTHTLSNHPLLFSFIGGRPNHLAT